MFKKLLFLTMFILLSGYGFSQGAYLQLSLYDDDEFLVTFDDKKLSQGNVAEFDNVNPGEHSLRVVKVGINVPAQENVIFDGKIKIPAGDNYAVIDEYNAFVIYKKKAYNFNRLIPCGDFIKRCGFGSYEKEPENTPDECRGRTMKKEDYKDLKSSIGNRNFESTNVSILKTALESNYVTSEQLRELLMFFTFDSNKLEVAKYAYKKVCDQKNFFKVYDAFSFETSVEELKSYISGK